jgi:hypothetical protein
MSKRYIKVARKYFESEEWLTPRKFSEPEAWIDMVQLASFADHDITLSNGGYITLYRGEFYYTMRQLAKRWGWSLGGVQRYFARLAEGTNPRIERIARDTRFDTPSDTQVDTQVIVVRLCNYASYNETNSNLDTPSDTPSDTTFDTLNKKGYNKKGNNNTHTSYLVLRDLFVQACMRNTREAHAEAARTAEEMALLTQVDAEAAQEHNTRCRRSAEYNLIFWLWWKYADLQFSFEKPLHPNQAKELLSIYKLDDIGYIIECIYNKRHTISGRSLFHTIKQWAKRDFSLKQPN